MEIIDNTFYALFDNIINPAVYAFSVFCFVWFLFGVGKFILAKYNADENGIKSGRNHMLWGLIGLIIVFSAGAIYKFITGFFE